MKTIVKVGVNGVSENSELTYEKLKTYKGFENVTESEAQNQIKAIKALAKILFNIFSNDPENEFFDNTEK